MDTRYCSTPPEEVPELLVDSLRASHRRWLNGTVIHYYFFDRDTDGSVVRRRDGTTGWEPWTGAEAQREVVRESFQEWKDVGIGLEFAEVPDRTEAELRIGFQRDGGSWSTVGTGALSLGPDHRTMTFGWDLTTARPLALHAIGHAIGMRHEHQSPLADILWDEEAVYSDLAGPPNFWNREKTFQSILRRHAAGLGNGLGWDPESVMGLGFNAGLILEPERYRTGLHQPRTLSAADRQWALRWYPPLETGDRLALTPFVSVPLELTPGSQADFLLCPDATRDYTVGVFGDHDALVVLFEEIEGVPRFLTGEDDAGRPGNARLSAHLVKGRRYHVRVRLRASRGPTTSAVMAW
jgi:hypothetical protein